MRFPTLLALVFTLAGCSRKTPPAEFPKMTEEFVYQSLAFSPVYASSQGLHEYQGRNFDIALDDLTRRSIEKQRQYFAEFHRRLQAFDRKALPPEDQADYDVMETQIGLSLFDIDLAQTWRHAPQMYVELIGAAVFNPYMVEYAPKEERFRHIIARLERVPVFLEIARRQLDNAPEIWRQTAIEENEGNIALVDKTLRAATPEALRNDYNIAASQALDALRAFNKYLGTELPARSINNPDWRLGTDKYAMKFKLALATDRTPDQVLADAESRLKEVRASMLAIALPLHAKWFAAHGGHDDLNGDARLSRIVREVMDKIAEQHSTPATFMDDARKDLAEARSFAAAKNLLTLPTNSNLAVIPTPEFMRGSFGVGGFNPAPALEPQLGAFYWITPIPENWPKERAESKLREYNFYALKILTIHEAMPGHYVQAEFANAIEPKNRRLLRSVFGNGPYVEGWAQYITQVMLDEGFLDNSPELRLSLLKQELRVDANAIMDVRMQTGRMTDAEAMNLMENTTFQEHEEAVAKIQRAKLSSTQLPTYFVGWRDWLRLREAVKKQRGSQFTLHDFHDQALKAGALPLPVVARLLTGQDLP